MAKLFRRRKVKGISDAQLDKVMKSKTVKDGVDAKAKAVAEYWKSVSPVFGDKPPHRAAPAHGQPGDYRDSIIVKDISDDAGAADRVKPTDFKAKWIEFGNAHMPEYAPMAKTKARFRR
jgi:hypothetical protein